MPPAKKPIGIRAVQAVHEMNRKSGVTVDQLAKRLEDAPAPPTIRRALMVGVREGRLMLCGDRYYPGKKGPKRAVAKAAKKATRKPRVLVAKRRKSKTRRRSSRKTKKRSSSRRRSTHRRRAPLPDHEHNHSTDGQGPEEAMVCAAPDTMEAKRRGRKRSRQGRPRRSRSASRKRRSGKSKPRRRRSRRADDVDGRQVEDQTKDGGQNQA